jgi:hypothetical protein
MEEAVEICKLRLFLKLVAQVDNARQVEPLPDIDFNIRPGNTLVGFASLDEVKQTLQGNLGFGKIEVDRIVEEAEIVNRAFAKFRPLQTEHGMDARECSTDKAELRRRLDKLRKELDRFLAGEYGVDAEKPKLYEQWRKSHQPFHWLAEFHGIMADGGFDVIIGNPPYVEYSKVQDEYRILGYTTEPGGNLYAFIVERNKALLASNSRSGMIVPHSAFCTDRMAPLFNLFSGPRQLWVSTYDIRPSKLFVGADQRLAIYLDAPSVPGGTFGTRYHRWQESERPLLFERLRHAAVGEIRYVNSIAKAEAEIELHIWRKLQARKPLINDLRGSAQVFYHNAPRYWIRALTFTPYFWNERDGKKVSTQVKPLSVGSRQDAAVTASALNSSLFYWWFILFSDSRHLNMREIERFHLGLREMEDSLRKQLDSLCTRLMDDYRHHAVRKKCQYKTTGSVVYDEFYPRHSKAIIDDIDRMLAEHYGFTDEELDFIINYDIKYRMGQDGSDEDGEE